MFRISESPSRETARTGYSETAVRERLGLADITDLKWKALPIYRQKRLAGRDAQAQAIELFFVAGRDWRELGLPYFLSVIARFFSDHAWHKLPHPGYASVPRDQVMLSAATAAGWRAQRCVGQLVPRSISAPARAFKRLLRRLHSERVLAVDINHRAARCARFNATISGYNQPGSRRRKSVRTG
jgi:hypothetical protein